MARIGMYGVYYSKCIITDATLTGYTGVKQLGKAISSSFEGADTDPNPLYANNGIAETDAQASAGGDLTLTVDRLKAEARTDLFSLEEKTASVTVGEQTVTGKGFDDTGSEQSNPVGVAFVRQKQEDGNRNIHEAVIYSYCTFKQPSEEDSTQEESVDWGTTELEATVSGNSVTGTYPWRKRYTFPTLAAAIQFITDYFAAAEEENS